MALCERNGQMFFDAQLLSFICQGDNDKARALLDPMDNLASLRNSAGQTLLHMAARYGNATMSDYLIKMGLEVNAENKFGITALALAVQYCHLQTIQVLLDAAADFYDSQHRECLLQTVYKLYVPERCPKTKHDEMFKMFRARLCEDYRRDKVSTLQKLLRSKCSLHCVASILRTPRVPRFYLQHGFDLNTPELHSERTALHAAVAATDFASVQLLLQNGAHVDALDCKHKTPLQYYNYSSKESDVKLHMLQYLLDHGASLTLANRADRTPLEYLLCNAKLQSLRIVMQRVTQHLTSASYRLQRTALHFLAQNTDAAVVTILQDKQFDVDARDQRANTPLMLAVSMMKNVRCVQFLLDHGADVNAENLLQRTALHLSVARSFQSHRRPKCMADICKLLLQRGANIQHVLPRWKKKKVVDHYTVFDLMRSNGLFDLSKFVIAQLVLNEQQGEPITDVIRAKIKCNEQFEQQLLVCKQQMDKMKVAKINDDLSMYDLLAGDEEQLMHHAIDLEFVSKLDQLHSDILRENNYYAELIRKRLVNVVNQLKSGKEYQRVCTQPTCCVS